MHWRYSITSGYQKLSVDPLEWKDGEDFPDVLTRNQYRSGEFEGGDRFAYSFGYQVHSRDGEVFPFLVCVDVNSTCYHIFVDDLPSLIELLAKMAPIAHVAFIEAAAELKHEEKRTKKQR